MNALSKEIRSIIAGAGGGGSSSARAPVEAPDSLRSIAYARILDMVGEGEIEGFADADKPLTCVFLNETPIANADDSLNFKNVQVDSRVGTQTQDYIKGFDGVESELGVNVELRNDTPYTRSVTNLNLSAVSVRLSVLALSKTNTTNGDVGGHTIAYRIQLATDGGSYVDVFSGSLTGKTTTKYERSHRIDLPAATTGWSVRVLRDTPDTTDSTIQDTTMVESVVEIIDAKLRMPMTALVSVIVDAEQFNNIPSRAYRLKGRIVKVPSNYNPVTRVYTGVWDGNFVPAYTNNPAWCFYDMVTNDRYGLGHLVPAALVDKWTLYTIAQYCDVLVDDGFGGMEPRFTCNVFFQTQNDALRVIQDLATVFRGIVYASGGAITAVGDMPVDPVYTYTAANVIDGKFQYSGSGRKARHTVALVSWTDLSDFGRAKVEYVDDPEGIARYGIQQTDVIAIGATSRGQARRLGKYILATERYETNLVSFGVGLDGTVAAPGKVVLVADPLRAGRRTGGRVRAATINTVTLDAVPVLAPGDFIIAILPDGTPQKRTVSTLVGNVVTVTANFTAIPQVESIWAVESSTLVTQAFRVLSVENRTDGFGHSITAMQHVVGKFDFAEADIAFDTPPISSYNLAAAPPTGLAVTQRSVADTNTTAVIVNLRWNESANATSYTAQWRQGNNNWVDLGSVGAVNVDIPNVLPGQFEVQVCAVNALGVKSVPTFGGPYTIAANTTAPGFVADLIAVDEINEAAIALETANRIADVAAAEALAASQLAAGLAAEATARSAALLALDTDIQAEIDSVEATLVAADAAEATQRNNLAVQLRGAYTGSDLNAVSTGLIADERAARVTADGVNATSITALQAQMIGSVGGNKLKYPSFIGGATTGWTESSHAVSGVYSPTLGGYHLSMACGATTGRYIVSPYSTQALAHAIDMQANPGDIYTYTCSVNCDGPWYLQIQFRNAAGATIATHDSAFQTSTAGNWRRVSFTTAAAPAGTTYMVVVCWADNTTNHHRIFQPMLQLGAFATPFDDNKTADLQASAVSVLDARVTSVEGVNTSQATSITTLNSTVASKADVSAVTALTTRVTDVEQGGYGVNLIPNSSLAANANGYTFTQSATPAWTTPTLNLGGASWHPARINALDVHNTSGALAAGQYINISTMAAEIGRAGEAFIASVYAACHRCQGQIFIEWLNAAGAVIGYSGGTTYNAGGDGNGGTDLTNWARLVATGTAPAGTQSAKVLVQFQGNGNGNPHGWIIRPMLERKRATQTLPSEWNAGGVEMFASHVLKLDVNGYVTGWTFGNDGTSGDFTITTDSFRLVTPGASPKTPFAMLGGNIHLNADLFMGAGRIISVNGGFMKVQGTGFGSSNQFTEWFGPYNANLATCTEANAVYYLKVNGDAYFGGSLSAGILKNAAQTTVTSLAAAVTLGPFGTNGGTKTVVRSLLRTVSQSFAGNQVATYNNKTTVLRVSWYRKVGAGSEALVSSFDVTGTSTAEWDFETNTTSVHQILSGSTTSDDTTGGTSDFTYRLQLSIVSDALGLVAASQSMGIISTEG